LRPGRFGIGYRDFAGSGEVHGQVKQVKDWLAEHGYRSYAVEKKGANVNRVYFLADARSEETLLARMLPFSSSNTLRLEELRLVANYGGYWVYEVPGAAEAR
jgi:hydroxylamine oxidation protein HaoB